MGWEGKGRGGEGKLDVKRRGGGGKRIGGKVGKRDGEEGDERG